MPLNSNALPLIREQLLSISRGIKPRLIVIGSLTPKQLNAINAYRVRNGFAAVVDAIFFDGRHLYKSRCTEDGYTIDQVLEQIASALDTVCEAIPGRMAILVNRLGRTDHNGRLIHDEAVLECTSRHPNPELYSVVPRGDGKNHSKKKKATGEGGLPQT